MASVVPEGNGARRLKKQRNLYAATAACLLASIGFAVPRRVSTYRELERVNARLVELQATIVQTQLHTREIQDEIVSIQLEIRKRQKQ